MKRKRRVAGQAMLPLHIEILVGSTELALGVVAPPGPVVVESDLIRLPFFASADARTNLSPIRGITGACRARGIERHTRQAVIDDAGHLAPELEIEKLSAAGAGVG